MGYSLQDILLAAPVIIFSLTFHEFFHAWTAFKFGDTTARDHGRLTLNPLAHLELFGTLMLFVSHFRFGWAKPVPVNPFNLRNPKRDDLWISFAGPLSNLGLAFVAGLLLRFTLATDLFANVTGLHQLLYYGVFINCSLAFFNLLPLYPLDGSHILRGLLPDEYESSLDQLERIAPMVLIGLIASGFLLGFSPLWMILGPFIKTAVHLFSGI
jgi:Zn-dependent protease